MTPWVPGQTKDTEERSTFILPRSAAWSVEQGDGGYLAVAEDGSTRLAEQSAQIQPAGNSPAWTVAYGPILEKALFDDVLQERDGASFIYRTHGTVASVIDLSPTPENDRFWDVKLVTGGNWVHLRAPLVPFEDVAAFVDALVEVNR